MGLLFGRSASPPQTTRAAYPAFTQEQLARMSGDIGTFSSINANSEVARQSVAVDTAIDLICSLASELPLHVYRDSGDTRNRVGLPSNLKDPGGDGHGLQDWVYQGLNSWLYRGNLYGEETEWDSRGRVRRISLYHPDDVSAEMDAGRVVWMVNGTEVPRQDLFYHRRVNPVPGRILGASVVEKHQIAIGTSLAAGRYGSQWFTEGAHPSGMLLNTEASINEAQATEAKSRWLTKFKGSREPVVMGKGWDWKPLQVTAEESQFLATMRWSEAQCARMFGPGIAEALGYESGSSMTYGNVVDRRADLLTLSLDKWLTRMERILTSLLPEPQYAQFDRDALLRSTTLTRYQAHALALSNQWKTVNEVRADEELAPVDWGDTPNEQPGTPAGPAGGN